MLQSRVTVSRLIRRPTSTRCSLRHCPHIRVLRSWADRCHPRYSSRRSASISSNLTTWASWREESLSIWSSLRKQRLPSRLRSKWRRSRMTRSRSRPRSIRLRFDHLRRNISSLIGNVTIQSGIRLRTRKTRGWELSYSYRDSLEEEPSKTWCSKARKRDWIWSPSWEPPRSGRSRVETRRRGIFSRATRRESSMVPSRDCRPILFPRPWITCRRNWFGLSKRERLRSKSLKIERKDL